MILVAIMLPPSSPCMVPARIGSSPRPLACVCLPLGSPLPFILHRYLRHIALAGYLQNLDQVLIMDRKRIAKHYLRGWFTVDLVSSIPLDLILLGTGSVSSAEQLRRLPKIFRIVKLSKLLRLLRVTKVTR